MMRGGLAVLRRSFAVCLLATVTLAGAATPPALEDALRPLLEDYERAVKPGDQVQTYRELFGSVFQRVLRSYAQDVDVSAMAAAAMKVTAAVKPQSGEPAAVFKSAVNAALADLDPHSTYLDPAELREQRSSIAGTFGGLGIEVDMVGGLVRVVAPMDNSPAARAGLKTGDLIVRFDDQNVQGMTLSDAISKMRGQPGTPISLLIRRPGREDEFTVNLVRETIRTQALRPRMEDDVLVIRLTGFTSGIGGDFERALTLAVAKQVPRAVILDMRGNPGGLLNQAVTVADAFLGQGEIVSLRGRTAGNRRSWKANEAEFLPGVPLLVLLDGGSASAAELVAAALQENGRALVLGQRSYGKGSVQTVMSLGADKGALRLTTALYHGPSGRTVQRTGVVPDIELVPPSSAPLPRGGRRESDRSHALAGADEPSPPRARIEQARCPKPKQGNDLVMSCALAFIKAGAMENFLAGLETQDSPALQ